jgi:sugar porter (SP) family MFS transporter
MLTMIVPMYMSEVSSPGIRGTLVVLQQLSITLGILVSYWLEYGTQYIGGHRCAPDIPYSGGPSDKPTFDPRYDVGPNGCTGQSEAAWRVPFALQIFPALVLGIGMIFFPESPRFYLMRHKEDKALAALAQLRQVHVDTESIRAEYLAIKTEVLFDESVSNERFPGKKGISLFAAQHVALVSTWPAFKRLAIGCCIMFFQQFMGCNAIIYYAPTMFAQLGLSGNTSGLLATGVYGIVNTLSTLPALFLIDKLGRRPLLMCGAAGTFISLVIVGGIVGGYGSTLTDNKSAGWVGIVFIYIYDVNFSFSFAPIGWVLPSEIFNLGNRSKAMAITTSATWMCNFIIGLVTPDMLATIGWGTYIFFAAFCLLAFLFTYFFVPETRGKSLEDMDLVFGDTASHEEKARLMEIASSMGLTEAFPEHKVALAKEDHTSAEHYA